MSQTRAILVAEAQAMLNRLRREVGGAGTASAGLVAALVIVAATPPAIGSFFLGRGEAQRFAVDGQREAAGLVLGRLHALMWLGFGLLGGLLGSDVEGPRGLRVFPLSRGRQFGTELVAAIASPLPVLAAFCLLGLSAGVIAARPSLVVPVLLLAAQGLLWVLLVQRVTARLRDTAARHLLAAAVAIALLAASAVTAGAARVMPLLAAAGRAFARSLEWMPSAPAWSGLAALADGRLAGGAALQLLPLAASAAFLLFVFRLSLRERPEGSSPRGRGRAERLWSFSHPATGIARLFVTEVARSRFGRTLLLVPPFAAACLGAVGALILQLEGRLPPQLQEVVDWHVPWAGLLPPLLVIMDSELWLNQFGWDGAGVRTLLALPIRPRHLLLGKLLGTGALVLGQLALVLPALVLASRPSPAEVLWGLAAGAFALLLLGGLGHVFSAGLPHPPDGGALGRGFSAMIVSAGCNAAAIAVLASTYRLSRLAGPVGPPIGLSLLAAVTACGYWRALDFLGERVMVQRDQLVSALG